MTATAVSIGDIFVDYIGDLTATEYQDVLAQISGSTNIFAPIDVQVGGAGLQFAVEAQAAGFTGSMLIGKIGGRAEPGGGITPDLPGSMVVEYLQQRGIRSLLAIAPDSETGRIIIIYLPPDRRLMLSDRLANALFMPSDITPEMQLAVRQAQLVHVSGYAFLQDSRRAAVLELVRHAKQGGAKVALDIVPHNFYKYMTLEQLREYVGDLVDWAFIEIPAAHQLIGLGRLVHISSELIDYTLNTLLPIFPSIALHLSPGHAIVVDGNERWEHEVDYQPGVTSRGQSARVQAQLLYWRLNR